jgi:hypothetical protein
MKKNLLLIGSVVLAAAVFFGCADPTQVAGTVTTQQKTAPAVKEVVITAAVVGATNYAIASWDAVKGDIEGYEVYAKTKVGNSVRYLNSGWQWANTYSTTDGTPTPNGTPDKCSVRIDRQATGGDLPGIAGTEYYIGVKTYSEAPNTSGSKIVWSKTTITSN